MSKGIFLAVLSPARHTSYIKSLIKVIDPLYSISYHSCMCIAQTVAQ